MDPELLKRLGLTLPPGMAMPTIGGGALPQMPTDFSQPSATPNFGAVPDAAPLPGSEDGGEGGYIPPDPGHVPGDLAPPDVPSKPNFVSRMLAHVLHLPSNAEGVFSDQDADAMRRSALLHASAALAGNNQQGFLPALIGAYSGMNSDFTNQVNTGIKAAGAAQDVQSAKSLREADQTIANKYPIPQNETLSQKLIRLTNMASDYASMGQPDRAMALAKVAANIKAAIAKSGNSTDVRISRTLGGDFLISDRSRTDANGNLTPFLTPGADPGDPKSWTARYIDPGVATKNDQFRERMTAENQREYDTMNRFDQHMFQNVQDKFADDKEVAPLGVMHTNFVHLKDTLQQAIDNPAAATQLAGQIAQFADSKGRLQLGFLNYLNNIDKSYGGQVQRYLQLALNGTLPPTQIANVSRLMDAIERGSEQSFEGARERYIATHEGIFNKQGGHQGRDLLENTIPHAHGANGVGGWFDVGGVGAGGGTMSHEDQIKQAMQEDDDEGHD